MTKSLISIIVPIYMVEEYLDECVQSIVRQTYSNIEIILVDDGGIDGCPQKCDEWAVKDSRIRVVHKSHGGLSSARNAGLDIAKGEYIAFVDSDDYITPDYVEVMYNRICNDDSVGIVSGMIYRLKDGKTTHFKEDWLIEEERIISSSKITFSCIQESVSHTVWNKLFKSHLLTDIRFREGRNNEDTLFMYDLGNYIVNTKYSMVEIPHYVYYYRYREDSICTSVESPINLYVIQNLKEMMNECPDADKEILDALYYRYVFNLFVFLESMLSHKVWKSLYFNSHQKELRKIPFVYLFRHFSIKEIKYIELLKWMPLMRRILIRVRVLCCRRSLLSLQCRKMMAKPKIRCEVG